MAKTYRYSDTRATRERITIAAPLAVIIAGFWIITRVPVVGGHGVYWYLALIFLGASTIGLLKTLRLTCIFSRPVTISPDGIAVQLGARREDTIRWDELANVQQVIHIDPLTSRRVSSVSFSSKSKVIRVRSNIDSFDDFLAATNRLLKAHSVVVFLRDLQTGGQQQKVTELSSLTRR